MKVELSRSESRKVRPKACFDLGQRITEVGAALAYADYFARRLGGSTDHAVRDVSAGVHTAQLAAGRLKDGLGGKAKRKAARFEKDLTAFNDRVRKGWIETQKRIETKDVVEIQRRTAELRRKATEIWSEVRLACPDGAAAKPRGKGLKAR